MTEQNWRDLPAGRELDRLVAERMGYEIVEDFGMGGPSYTALLPGSVVMELPRAFGEDEGWEQVTPHYSTSVDAALALVPGGDIAFELYRDENTGDWWAEFDGWYDEGSPWPALAIVRAWLLWKDGTA